MSTRSDPLEDGGAPKRGEPVAIEFANTRYASRGTMLEGIGTRAHLGAWLRDNSTALGDAALSAARLRRLTDDDVEQFLALRDGIRDVATEVCGGAKAPRRALDAINTATATAPEWPALRHDGKTLCATTQSSAAPSDRVRAAIARSAIALFSGPQRDDVRACGAPGCVLFFLKDHPRRAWCSDGCGNRARQARYYDRHRAPDRTP